MIAMPHLRSVRAAYECIKAHQSEHSRNTMCRVLGVARSGFYAWVRRPQSDHAAEDARLLRSIRALFVASHGIYRAPRVFLDLRESGEACSKNRVARLMRVHGLRAWSGYRVRHAASGKPAVLVPNLLQRQFTVTRPNAAWVTDITYIRTTEHPARVRPDGPPAGGRTQAPPRYADSFDQGTQYGSVAWRRFWRSHRLAPSMSRKGNCWDAGVESFFSSLKKERIKKHNYRSRELAIADIADIAAYIDDFYNRTRRRSHIGGVSSEQFEADHKSRRATVH
jgi:putative transposase